MVCCFIKINLHMQVYCLELDFVSALSTNLVRWLWTRTCAALAADRCAPTGEGCRWTPWLRGGSWGAPRTPASACPGYAAGPALRVPAWVPQRLLCGFWVRLWPVHSRLSGRRRAVGRPAGRAASLRWEDTPGTGHRGRPVYPPIKESAHLKARDMMMIMELF